MDNELHQLCKEVYEKTGWYGDELPLKDEKPTEDFYPLYTPDYLLEKLFSELITEESHIYLMVCKSINDFWVVFYGDGAGNKDTDIIRAGTPLKALLKLVIALNDAGVNL